MENNTESGEQPTKVEETVEAGPVQQPGAANDTPGHQAEASPLQKLQDELAEAKDKYVRLYAEFDNYRRRTAKEKLELIRNAGEELIVALLPVVDDFERAAKSNANKAASEAEGYLLIQAKLKKILDQYGLSVMNTSPGEDFNPDLHEAITQVAAAEEKLKGKIVDTTENGYLLKDKVIRHAKVVIGN